MAKEQRKPMSKAMAETLLKPPVIKGFNSDAPLDLDENNLKHAEDGSLVKKRYIREVKYTRTNFDMHPDLHMRLGIYLTKNKLTMKDFITKLVEDKLNKEGA